MEEAISALPGFLRPTSTPPNWIRQASRMFGLQMQHRQRKISTFLTLYPMRQSTWMLQVLSRKGDQGWDTIARE
jgi:hypothetical protein